MMDETLRRLQLTQLEILKVVDRFCRENDIKYSLYAGTLIGAVRHKGFIPWDDDLDICMARDQYDKFIELWNAKRPVGYLLQNKENTPGFTQSFTKIRKEHTTFLQPVDLPERYHVGIFIDVFPVDRIPHGRIRGKIYQTECVLYQLFTKEYIPVKAGKLEELISKLILKGVPKSLHSIARTELYKQVTKYNTSSGCHRIMTESMKMITTPLPVNMMDDFCDMQFEDGLFMCTKQWDPYLKVIFGDYMTPPPESERISIHNALVIDFEHDYYELKSCNKRT